MFTLTRKADYGLVALADLARHAPKLVSARKLAERNHIRLPVLTNILNQLLHHRIVSSTRGPRGGYTLTRPTEQVSLLEIIDAIEGPVRMTVCCSGSDRARSRESNGRLSRRARSADGELICDLEQTCQIKAPVQRVNDWMRQFLSEITLAQIIQCTDDTFFVPLTLSVSVDGTAPARGAAAAVPQA